VTAENPAKTTKPTNSKVPFGVRSHVLDEGSDPLRDWQFLREGDCISKQTAKYGEYLLCCQYFQQYSVGGSSNVAFCGQYCTTLLDLVAVISLPGRCAVIED